MRRGVAAVLTWPVAGMFQPPAGRELSRWGRFGVGRITPTRPPPRPVIALRELKDCGIRPQGRGFVCHSAGSAKTYPGKVGALGGDVLVHPEQVGRVVLL